MVLLATQAVLMVLLAGYGFATGRVLVGAAATLALALYSGLLVSVARRDTETES